MSIGNRIKTVRTTSGLTQQAFADRLGLKQNTVATYEMGKTSPSPRTLADICRVFDVNPDWLETGEGEMFVKRSMDQELAALVGQLLHDRDEAFRKQLVLTLLRYGDDEWGLLEKFAADLAEIVEKTKKDPDS